MANPQFTDGSSTGIGSSTGTEVNVDEQTLGTTSLGTATSTTDEDSNLIDTGGTDPGITITENDKNGNTVAGGTDNDRYDGSSPAGGAGESRATFRQKTTGKIHQLTIKGKKGMWSPFSGSVTGKIQKGAKADPDDHVSGSNLTGMLGAKSDTFRFTGKLKNIDVPQAAKVYVDGNRIDEPTNQTKTSGFDPSKLIFAALAVIAAMAVGLIGGN